MKQTVTLFSLAPHIYPNIEIEVELIEDVRKVLDDITKPEIITAKKTGRVQARYGKYGEKIDTRPRVEFNGKTYTFSETQKTISISNLEANEKPVVVTNPDGEQYIISSYDKFAQKYKASGTYDLFDPIDTPKKFKVSNGNYAIMASWGEPQIVLKDSLFCIQDPNDIYGITNSAFNSTYQVIERELPNEMGE